MDDIEELPLKMTRIEANEQIEKIKGPFVRKHTPWIHGKQPPNPNGPLQSKREQPNLIDRDIINKLRHAGVKRPETIPNSEWRATDELSHRHKLICYMASLGFDYRHIANQVGVSETTVSHTCNSQAGRLEIERLQGQIFGEDPQRRFKKLLNDAISTTEEIMSDPSEKGSVRLAAANTVMDRAMGKPKQEVEHKTSSIRALFERLDAMDRQPAIELTPQKQVSSNEIEGELVTEAAPPKEEPPKDEIDQWIEDNL